MKKMLLTMTVALALFSIITIGSSPVAGGGTATTMEHGVGHG